MTGTPQSCQIFAQKSFFKFFVFPLRSCIFNSHATENFEGKKPPVPHRTRNIETVKTVRLLGLTRRCFLVHLPVLMGSIDIFKPLPTFFLPVPWISLSCIKIIFENAENQTRGRWVRSSLCFAVPIARR